MPTDPEVLYEDLGVLPDAIGLGRGPAGLGSGLGLGLGLGIGLGLGLVRLGLGLGLGLGVLPDAIVGVATGVVANLARSRG